MTVCGIICVCIFGYVASEFGSLKTNGSCTILHYYFIL
jgi:hypothetical protein